MIILLIIIFYIFPTVFMLDVIHIIYKFILDSDEEIYIYHALLAILISICPIINIIVTINYFDILDDELWEYFKKYSIFKFLFTKLK